MGAPKADTQVLLQVLEQRKKVVNLMGQRGTQKWKRPQTSGDHVQMFS